MTGVMRWIPTPLREPVTVGAAVAGAVIAVAVLGLIAWSNQQTAQRVTNLERIDTPCVAHGIQTERCVHQARRIVRSCFSDKTCRRIIVEQRERLPSRREARLERRATEAVIGSNPRPSAPAQKNSPPQSDVRGASGGSPPAPVRPPPALDRPPALTPKSPPPAAPPPAQRPQGRPAHAGPSDPPAACAKHPHLPPCQ